MRRNNNPRGAEKHDELQAPKRALTDVDALLWPPSSPRHRDDGVGMLVCRPGMFTLLARTQAAQHSRRNAITAGILSRNEQRAKSWPHDVTKCLMAAATMPTESPPPVAVPVVRGRARPWSSSFTSRDATRTCLVLLSFVSSAFRRAQITLKVEPEHQPVLLSDRQYPPRSSPSSTSGPKYTKGQPFSTGRYRQQGSRVSSNPAWLLLHAVSCASSVKIMGNAVGLLVSFSHCLLPCGHFGGSSNKGPHSSPSYICCTYCTIRTYLAS